MDTYVLLEEFEAQSSAFDVLRTLLTVHPEKSVDFLTHNYDKFFGAYNKLLTSGNYVVRRHAAKSMGQVLVVREHHDLMLKYVSEKSNLKIWMNLLRDPSESIQLKPFMFLRFCGKSDYAGRRKAYFENQRWQNIEVSGTVSKRTKKSAMKIL